ncbi:hypothetical protein QJS10_CPA06g00479 [Acorus calamus]|uniref:Uncharacterized protein n=1 Tax=Acorus calamus TaxID=4465 RepID=A0AAV9EPC8_ACOCL|nr:hypothetical protein QJS10_CPA06g00479 [Acorus calamus]
MCGSRPFRFEKFWLEYSELPQLVQLAWNSEDPCEEAEKYSCSHCGTGTRSLYPTKINSRPFIACARYDQLLTTQKGTEGHVCCKDRFGRSL